MSEERLRKIEELVAHQARTIDELSDELMRQSEAIRAMQRRLDAVSERFAALEDTVTAAPEAGRPPHW